MKIYSFFLTLSLAALVAVSLYISQPAPAPPQKHLEGIYVLELVHADGHIMPLFVFGDPNWSWAQCSTTKENMDRHQYYPNIKVTCALVVPEEL